MGQFSWLDCADESQKIYCDKLRKVYVLIPKEFGGGFIQETYYEGYGVFGGRDIYELVATWNRTSISDKLLTPPKVEEYLESEYYQAAVRNYEVMVEQINDFKEGKKTDEEMAEKYGNEWLRDIGIEIACEDEQNAGLRYPIKITNSANQIYENCPPSKTDPNQGW